MSIDKMVRHTIAEKGFNPQFVRIVASKFGEVNAEEIDLVIDIMEECYERLRPHNVEIVDLYLFDRASAAEAFLAKEKEEVGVMSESFSDLFFATHDAWRGTPRIILCFEKMSKLPKTVQVGGIQHEVGHSVLHGSLHYYFLPFPPTFLHLANRFDLSLRFVTNLFYLTSIAVKDYEVSRLLYKEGYKEDQIIYVKHLLRVSEDDLIAWEMSKGKPLAEILFLISCLKTAGCAAPYLFDKKFSKDVKFHLMDNLTFLPEEYTKPFFNAILRGFPSLKTDTLSNINLMSCLITESIIEPILQK